MYVCMHACTRVYARMYFCVCVHAFDYRSFIGKNGVDCIKIIKKRHIICSDSISISSNFNSAYVSAGCSNATSSRVKNMSEPIRK